MASHRITFSNTALTNITPPTTGRDVYHDIKTPGLELRVTPSGTKTFSVFKRLKSGHPERVTLDRFPAINVEQARKLAGKTFNAISEGVSLAAVKRAHKEEMTFGELFDQYLERHAKPNKVTYREDQQRYNQYLKQPLGSKKLSSIDQKTIRDIHLRITREGAGHPVVANRVLAVISTTFGRGIEWGYVKENPSIGVRRNKEHSRDRFLQPEEIRKFFDALALEANETVRDFIFVALLTGARKSNVLSMRWSEIDLDRGIWRIAMTKNGTPQNVVLVTEVIERLSVRKDAADADSIYVFPGDGKTGHLAVPTKGWLRVLASAGIEDLRIHDLRRTMGSWQAMTGASLPIIGKSLNHKTPQATSVYARLHQDPVKESMEKATKAMVNAGRKEVVDSSEAQPPAKKITSGPLSAIRRHQGKKAV